MLNLLKKLKEHDIEMDIIPYGIPHAGYTFRFYKNGKYWNFQITEELLESCLVSVENILLYELYKLNVGEYFA